MDKGGKLQGVEPAEHNEEKVDDRPSPSNSGSSVQIDDSILTNEAQSLMRKMLPSHIVNCLLQTGYDTLDVLAEINNESLIEIERIINSEYPNEICFRHQPVPTAAAPTVLKFSPGHRKRIMNFVEEIKDLINTRQKDRTIAERKRTKNAITKGAKYARVSDDIDISTSLGVNDSAANTDYNELDMLQHFRQSFAKWQRQPKNIQYSEIKENKDFFVDISVSAPDNIIKASVRCHTCSNTELLGVKSGKVSLSNWYRHIQHYCRKKCTGSKSLDSFFTVSATKKSMNAASKKTVTTVDAISPTGTDECKQAIM